MARRGWHLGTIAFAAVATLARFASAATPITLAGAIEAGARRGPAVVEATQTRAAARAFSADSGSSLPAPPQLTVMAGARKPRGLPLGPEVVLTAQQELSTRHLGRARARAAEWVSHTASSEVERAKLEGALAAALAWIDLREAQELERVRTLAVADAEKLARIADVRVTSGASTATERALAMTEVGAAKLSVLEAEGRATEARYALALAAGEPLDTALVAEGTLEPDDRPFDAQKLVAQAPLHPALVSAESRASQARADVDVARAMNGPFVTVGATAWREGSGDKAAAAIVTLPLPFFDPARYETARLDTIATAASAHAARVRAELERDLRIELHERAHTREVRARLAEDVVQPLRRALETSMLAYAAGTADLAVVLMARRSTLSADERLVGAIADVRRADVHAAALVGTLLPRSAP